MRKNELNETIETIYFGGGTPSLLNNNEIQLILDAIFNHYQVSPILEITLEANPDDLTKNKIIELSKSPINRLSIGVQSFFNDDLQFMNRAHNANESLHSITFAAKYFDNISIDLIYGIPKMTHKKWLKNLKIAFSLKINHLSCYALTVEKNTALYQFIKKGKCENVDESLALAHYHILLSATAKNNFINYETSNFGKQGCFSKHNISYWNGIKYLGIGPSAHSFNQKERSWNVANNTKYIKAIEANKLPSITEKLSEIDLFNEAIMIGLRTHKGISLTYIENNFGLEKVEYLLQTVKKHSNNKTLIIENQYIKATKKGKFLIDGIASDLFVI